MARYKAVLKILHLCKIHRLLKYEQKESVLKRISKKLIPVVSRRKLSMGQG